MSYRVVYGETMPSWEAIVPTRREADRLARKHKRMGDIVNEQLVFRDGNAR